MFELENPAASHSPSAGAKPNALAGQYRRVRRASLDLVAGLSAEDALAQSMPQASPAKWHLAHTTWFFEQFVLGLDPAYRPYAADWMVLFNSYYQTVGPMHARPRRGLLTRPSLGEVLDYRAAVDERMQRLLEVEGDSTAGARIVLGLQHEQQHQELLLTDIKHLFSLNPLHPVFRQLPPNAPAEPLSLEFVRGRDGLVEIGASGGEGFAFDCETPRHRSLLHPHALANRPVSNGEYAEFIRDGGYRTPTLWLAEGWDTVQAQAWTRPLYWSEGLDSEFSLGGMRALEAHAPVCHISYFEADAFARWAGARLPTEAEWESAASQADPRLGNFVESGALHPRAATGGAGLHQLFGDVWEWTSSPFVGYPGYRAADGALGEYNGKFMCGQFVLRGGSCATPAGHIRASYRNFFAPAERWQFMGLRLGQDR
jgi:ergothioneine biosynthesis protein EgtB